MDYLGISTPMQSYHDFNEQEVLPGLLESLHHGNNLALISDAGTPLICDPGYQLVKTAHDQGIRLVPVPGASALSAALSISGIATDKFIFEGFLPAKQASRKKRLDALARETRTMVFYEAPHRILEFLQDVTSVFGHDRMICVCRELTKHFETIYRDAAGSILDIFLRDRSQLKGEFVVIIRGCMENQPDFDESVRVTWILLNHGISVKQASAIAADITGVGKNDLYKIALELKGK